ncbi:hypothetical protein BOO88_10770 [Stutzerimonas stutzeri]|nr:hypothetical protein BOO89_08125 [Stutzerimonas stutzeri]AZO89385.1 hypothetical protein BOO88_10770 [Stutzerimonas stutzeri]
MPLTIIIAIFCILTNLQEVLIQRAGLSFLSSLDEAFCLLAYIIIPITVRKKRDAWLYLILLIPIISVLHGTIINTFVFSQDRLTQVFLQSIINFKLFFYFAIFYCAQNKNEEKSAYPKIFLICVAISLLGYAANLYSPEFFIFSDAAWQIERNRISGFQLKPNDLAILLGFALIYCLFLNIESRLKFLLITTLLLLVYATSSRTALIFSALSIATYFFLAKKRKITLTAFYIALIVSLTFYENILNSFFISETLLNLSQLSEINQTQYIRAIMVYYGFLLAAMYPLGVGAGNFGTVMSANSPAYEVLGVSKSYFFYNMTGIYDSNLAAVIGEYGILGLVIFYILTRKTLKHTLKDNPIKIRILLISIIILALTQPIYAYQVNAVNFLLLTFSLRNLGEKRFHSPPPKSATNGLQ